MSNTFRPRTCWPADLDEEQKQSILVAMSCPCCGADGLSYTVKLKRKL